MKAMCRTLSELHGIKTQNTTLFVVTALRTSTPTKNKCFLFLICGLFDDAVNISNNTLAASNGRMVNERWTGKYLEGSGP
jgi:hypothetical protein